MPFGFLSLQKAPEPEPEETPQTESEVVVNPEDYIKHPLQNR